MSDKAQAKAKIKDIPAMSNTDIFDNSQIEEAKIRLSENDKSNVIVSKCPTHLLPKLVQQIIEDCGKFHHHQEDYLAMSMLCAISGAIGNLMLYESILGYHDHALMYMVMVGERGVGKTHPITWTLEPFKLKNKKEYELYQATINSGMLAEKVPYKKFLLKDFTIEKLKSICKDNPRGSIIHVDELKKFFENGHRYNGVGFEDDLLEIFSRGSIDNDRSKNGWIMLESIFTNLIGTTQPANLKHFFGSGKLESGLSDRFIFIYPNKPVKRHIEMQVIPTWHKEKWIEIIYAIMDTDEFREIDPVTKEVITPLYNVIKFNEAAQKRYVEYVNKNIRDESTQVEQNIEYAYSKLETYIGRFALTINTLRWACGERGVAIKEIDLTSMNIACEFIEYIKTNIFKVHELEITRNPTTKLKEWEMLLFTELEVFCDKQKRSSFKTEEALVIADKLSVQTKKKGFSRRSVCTFLQNQKLFKSDQRGSYYLVA